MAIEPSDVPAAAIRAVSAGVGKAAASALSPLSRAQPGSLSLAMPHRTACLPFGKIRPDLVLRSGAQMGSWRFLVHEQQAMTGKNAPPSQETFLPVAAATAVAVG